MVIPEPLREELRLDPGDALEMESTGGQITLRPFRGAGPLTKEHGVCIFHSAQPLPASATDDMLDLLREEPRPGESQQAPLRGFFDMSSRSFMAITHTTPPVLPGSFDKTSGRCAAESLMEVYSTLTRMPGKHRISSEQALLFIDSIRERLSAAALDGEECADALKSAATRGVVGGGIYDAMIAHCALKAKADVIYSWNIRHYQIVIISVEGAVSDFGQTPERPGSAGPSLETPLWPTLGRIVRNPKPRAPRIALHILVNIRRAEASARRPPSDLQASPNTARTGPSKTLEGKSRRFNAYKVAQAFSHICPN